MNWDFFQNRTCLTTKAREWKKADAEFSRVGLSVEKFQSLPDIGPHQSFSKSVRRILTDFNESDANTLLHLEDDCTFRDLSHLENALGELPSDWDIVYLGANLILWNNGEVAPERFSKHLFRVSCAWTTHAIGYNKKCVPFILENQPDVSERMFDNYLSDLLPRLNAYIVAPMVAWQRPHHSLIWNKFDDYTPIFEASEARLK
jgi:hypothetical protein